MFADVKSTKTEKPDRSGLPVQERLHHRIIDGDRDGLTEDLDAAMASGVGALEIVNDVLLGGMKVVGELFGSGQMQLPFVLQSAETMKTAVAYLEPHMERVGGSATKGRLVIATVKGDVHDIGKNLVDIICTNNGYEVHNLGIKVPIGEMVAKVKEVEADAIGMSGLLVKSTLIMRENLEELNSFGLSEVPVLLGGAALTRRYVERDLREIYEGRLFYGKDAFEGLSTLDALMAMKRSGEWDPEFGRVPTGRELPERSADTDVIVRVPPRGRRTSPTTTRCSRRRSSGRAIVKGIGIDEIAEYVNETALYRNQWQFRPEKDAAGVPESDDAFKARIRATFREQLAAAKADGRARAAGRLRLLPGQRRRRRPRRVDRRVAADRGGPLPVPPPEGGAVPVHRRLLPRRRLRGPGLRRLPHRHDGCRGQRGRRPACSPPTSTSGTSCCTGSAWRWPRRSPSTGTGGSATSGGSSARTARR